MPHPMTDEQAQFVERMGTLIADRDKPRIAGRIMGWLLICEPPYQSFNQLVEVLGVSKGSISGVTRQMADLGLIERYVVRGERTTYFRIAPDAWIRLLYSELEAVRQFAAAADEGLAVAERERPDDNHWRLRDMRNLNRLAASQLPTLIEAFERSREEPPV